MKACEDQGKKLRTSRMWISTTTKEYSIIFYYNGMQFLFVLLSIVYIYVGHLILDCSRHYAILMSRSVGHS